MCGVGMRREIQRSRNKKRKIDNWKKKKIVKKTRGERERCCGGGGACARQFSKHLSLSKSRVSLSFKKKKSSFSL